MPDRRAGISAERTANLLERMVAIYSPSGKEVEITRFLSHELQRRGLPVHRQSVDVERQNLLVLPEGELSLLFVGHVDTVHAADFEDITAVSRDGELRGLGAADMKGGCAAMIEAVAALYRQKGRHCGVGLALVVGEEENGDGAEALIERVRPPHAIIGEPTALLPCLDHFGYLEVSAEVKGARRHASLADARFHPVESLLELTMALAQYLQSHHPPVTYNFRDLRSSQAGFAVPDWATVCIDIHLPPDMGSPSDLAGRIEGLFSSVSARYESLEARIRFPTLVEGYAVDEADPFVALLRAAFKAERRPFSTDTFVSHSDGNLLKKAGIIPVILGPGSLSKAHAPNESVRIDEVIAAARLYLEIGLLVASRAKSP
jgi:acetylornithine deacetylase